MKQIEENTGFHLYRVLTAVIIIVCLPLSAGLADIPEESGDLMDEIESIRVNIPGSGDEGFEIPTSTELNNWREICESLLLGRVEEVDSLVTDYFPTIYEFVLFTDTDYQNYQYYILREISPIQKGWGTYILGVDYQREIAIEVPHARYEINTPSEGIDIFRRTGSRVFIMTGTHRCSNDQWSPCDGSSSVCGDGHYHISDVAHNVDCFYQLMHEAFTDIYPLGYSFSIHGTSSSDCPDIFLSNGRGDDSQPIIYEMKDRMNSMGDISVSVAGDGTSSCTLTGATNVQGRYTNSSPNPCYQAAYANNGHFIHAEQQRRVRDNYSVYVKFIDAINSTILPVDYIASAGSGSWTDGATWIGAVVPDSTENVLINSGHTISVDNNAAVCNSVFFGGNDALIDMNSNSTLTVYGDFTLYSINHCVFAGGWSASDAYIRFAGSAVQNLSGWDPDGGSTSFRDVIVDKSGGRVQTSGTDMRLGIQNSLEIVNGLFELEEGDDIEGRWATSGNFTGNSLPNIIIRENGELHMADGTGAHHVRSDYESGNHLPIGTVTVYGKATFRDASSRGINLTGVDIENGGKVVTSTAMGGGEFECGPLTIKADAELENYTTSDIWGSSAVVTLQDGGLYDTKSSSTVFPASFSNNGTIRYSREGTTDQQITDMDYQSLQISLDPDNSKIWDLSADRVIADTLKINYDGNLVITATSAHKVTVGEMLEMSTGSIDIADPEVCLELVDGVLITRALGTISNAPLFAGMVDIVYTSTSTNVTTGPELPNHTDVLNDFELTGDAGVTLGADLTVNGSCTATGSDIFTDTHTLTLGPSANLMESDSITVVGTVTATRTVPESVNETFGGIGLEIDAGCIAPGVTSVTRVTGTALDIAGSDGIKRYFEISPSENIGLDATVVAHYDQSELNGISETDLEIYSRYDSGGDWFANNGTVKISANKVTATGINSMGTLTLGPDGVVTDVHDEGERLPEVTRLVSVYPNPFNPATRIKFELSRIMSVRISVYDVNGREVCVLRDGVMDAGRHELNWNGRNSSGGNVSSGIYFCRMVTDRTSQTMKMVLLR
ncbi:MAG: T9SS type A sorting domain-containing protein [Candidatus Latescibacteria bacterium]|nr:T9SS type A sorting domain-containing protein [bacterium]MBD3424249.1 T9SS type A sorting domain-containing protein [Candidatus Latescibacterota bacterium]